MAVVSLPLARAGARGLLWDVQPVDDLTISIGLEARARVMRPGLFSHLLDHRPEKIGECAHRLRRCPARTDQAPAIT